MTDAILLPYQQRWSKDAAPVKIWEKSRRIGASYSEAADNVLHAASGSGGNVGYISYNKAMTAGYIGDCARWATVFQQAISGQGERLLTRDDGRDVHVFDMAFASGHSIQAFSGNPRNLRSFGRPGDVVVVDEAAFIDDLEELLKAAMAVTVWGGALHLLSTHNGADNPFATLIEDTRAGRYRHSLHRTTLDDALADGLYRRICRVAGRDWSAEAEAAWRAELIQRYRPNEDEELFAIPALGAGTYFPRALLEACMPAAGRSGVLVRFYGSAAHNLAPRETRRREMADWIAQVLAPALGTLVPGRRHTIGMDFARKGDMTAILVLELGETLQRTWRVLVELHNTPYDQQDQVLAAIERATPRLGAQYIDATGNGGSIAEAAVDRRGSRVLPVMFTEAVYRERMPKYKAGIEDRTTTLIRHDDVLQDHRAIQLIRGVPRPPDGKTDARGERHGDSAIAGMLADWAADEDRGPLTIASGGRRAAAGLTAGYG
jgi:phage FluMu gp28-like protein